MANGIVIDVGFASKDLETYINKIKKDFEAVDFGEAIGLEDSFKEQAKHIRSELSKLEQEIKSSVGGKTVEGLENKFKDLSKTVNGLVGIVRDIGKSIPNNSGIANMLDDMQDLKTTAEGVAGAIKDINHISKGNTSVVNNDELKETLELLKNIQKSTEEGKSFSIKNKKNESDIEFLDRLGKKIDDSIKKYNKLNDEAFEFEDWNTKDAIKKNQELVDSINEILDAISKFSDRETELTRKNGLSLDKFIPSNYGFTLKQIKSDLENQLFGIQEDVEKRIYDINNSLGDIGNVNTENAIKKTKKTAARVEEELTKERRGQIQVPLRISDNTKDRLYDTTIALIKELNEKVADKPVEIKVAFTSRYLTTKNQELLDQLSANFANADIGDEELKQKVTKLVDDLNRQFDKQLRLDVEVKGAQEIYEKTSRLVKELQKEFEDADFTVYPHAKIKDEDKAELAAEINSLFDGVNLNIGIAKEDSIVSDKKAINKEFNALDILRGKINKIKESVDAKTQAFLDEEEIVDVVAKNESEYLNQVYSQLLMITDEASEFANIFKKGVHINYNIDEKGFNSFNILVKEIRDSINALSESLTKFKLSSPTSISLPTLNPEDIKSTENVSAQKQAKNTFDAKKELNEEKKEVQKTNEAIVASVTKGSGKIVSDLQGVFYHLNNLRELYLKTYDSVSRTAKKFDKGLDRKQLIQSLGLEGDFKEFNEKQLYKLKRAEFLDSLQDKLNELSETYRNLYANASKAEQTLYKDYSIPGYSQNKKKDATSQLRSAYKEFKKYASDQTKLNSTEGAIAGYAYLKSYEVAIKEGVSDRTLSKLLIPNVSASNINNFRLMIENSLREKPVEVEVIPNIESKKNNNINLPELNNEALIEENNELDEQSDKLKEIKDLWSEIQKYKTKSGKISESKSSGNVDRLNNLVSLISAYGSKVDLGMSKEDKDVVSKYWKKLNVKVKPVVENPAEVKKEIERDLSGINFPILNIENTDEAIDSFIDGIGSKRSKVEDAITSVIEGGFKAAEDYLGTNELLPFPELNNESSTLPPLPELNKENEELKEQEELLTEIKKLWEEISKHRYRGNLSTSKSSGNDIRINEFLSKTNKYKKLTGHNAEIGISDKDKESIRKFVSKVPVEPKVKNPNETKKEIVKDSTPEEPVKVKVEFPELNNENGLSSGGTNPIIEQQQEIQHKMQHTTEVSQQTSEDVWDDWGTWETTEQPANIDRPTGGILSRIQSSILATLETIPAKYLQGYVRSLDDIKTQLISEGVPKNELDSKANDIRNAEINAISDVSDGFIRVIHRTRQEVLDSIMKNGLGLYGNGIFGTTSIIDGKLDANTDYGTHYGNRSFIVADIPGDYFRAFDDERGVPEEMLGDLKKQYEIEREILSISDEIEKIYNDTSAIEQRNKLFERLLELAYEYNKVVGNGGQDSLSLLLRGDKFGGETSQMSYNSISKIQDLLSNKRDTSFIEQSSEKTYEELSFVDNNSNIVNELSNIIDKEETAIGLTSDLISLFKELWGTPQQGMFSNPNSLINEKGILDGNLIHEMAETYGLNRSIMDPTGQGVGFEFHAIRKAKDIIANGGKALDAAKEILEFAKETFQDDRILDFANTGFLDDDEFLKNGSKYINEYFGFNSESSNKLIENSIDGNFRELGTNAVDGYTNGIIENISQVKDATAKMTEEGIDSVQETQDSHSPSVKYYNLGRDAMEGYRLGILSKAQEVKDAIVYVISGSVDAAKGFDFSDLNSLANNINQLINVLSNDKSADRADKFIENINKLATSLQAINIQQSPLLDQINKIITKSKEIGQLAKVVSAGKKSIDAAANATGTGTKKQKTPEQISNDIYAQIITKKKEIVKLTRDLASEDENVKNNAEATINRYENEITSLEKQIKVKNKLKQTNIDILDDQINRQKVLNKMTIDNRKEYEEYLNANTIDLNDLLGGDDSHNMLKQLDGYDEEWLRAITAAHAYKDVLGDVVDIVRQIRKDGDNYFESYRITGKDGNSIVKGLDGNYLLSRHKVVSDLTDSKELTKAYQLLNTEKEKYFKIQKKIESGKGTNIDDASALNIENRILQIEEEIADAESRGVKLSDEALRIKKEIAINEKAYEKDLKDIANETSENERLEDINRIYSEMIKYLKEINNLKSRIPTMGETEKADANVYLKRLQSRVSSRKTRLNVKYGSNALSREQAQAISDLEYKNTIANAKASDIRGTKNNEEAIDYYNKLISKAKEYWTLKQREFDGTITSKEKDLLDEINSEYIALINNSSKYLINTNATKESIEELTSVQDTFKKLISNGGDGFSDYLSLVQNSFRDMFNNLNNMSEMSKFTKEFKNELKNLAQDLNSFYLLDDLSSIQQDKLLLKIKELSELYDEIILKSRDRGNKDIFVAQTISVQKYGETVARVLHENSSMSRELKYEYDALYEEIKLLLSQAEITQEQASSIALRVKQLGTELERTGQKGKSFVDKLKNAFTTSTAQFLVRYFSLQDFIRYIRTAYQYVKEFDSALKELRVVSGASAAELSRVAEASYDVAKSLGETTNNVINSVTEWRRLGYTIEQSLTLAQAASKLSTGGLMEVSTATEALTSTIQAFDNINVDNISDAVDSFIYVGNNYAISAEQLSTSLEKSSAALVAAGNSFNEVQALEVAGNTILQDSDTVANALKVLSMRLRGTSAKELADVGEDTEGLIENASKLNNTIKNLTKTVDNPDGISIINTDTNSYKSTYEILREIAEVYDELDDANRSALLETIAGKTRGAAAAAIIKNKDILESVYNDLESGRAIGAGDKAMESSLDSIDKKVIILQNDLRKLVTDAFNSEDMKRIIDFGDNVINFLDKIIQSFGLLPAAGVGLASFLAVKNPGGINDAIFGKITDKVFLSKELIKLQDKETTAINNTISANERYRISKEKSAIATAALASNVSAETTTEMKSIVVKAGLETSENGLTLSTLDHVLSLTEEEAALYGVDGATLKHLQTQAAEIKMNYALEKSSKALSIARGVLTFGLTTLISFGLPKLINLLDNIIITDEEVLKSLKENTEIFEKSTNKLKEYNDELKVNKDRLQELINLKNNGGLTQNETNEYENLKKENEELSRKIALEKMEQKQAAEDILNKKGKAHLSEETRSYLINDHDDVWHTENRTLTTAEMMAEDIENYKKATNEADKKYFEDVIEGYYDENNQAILNAYEQLDQAGFYDSLSSAQKEEYAQLQKLKDLYILFGYTLNNATDSYRALTLEQKKNALSEKFTSIFGEDGKGIVDLLSDEEIENLDLDKLLKLNFGYYQSYGKNADIDIWTKNVSDYIRRSLNDEFKNNPINPSNIFDNIGDFLEISDNSSIRDDLIGLAQNGKLDAETLKSYKDYDKIIKALKGSANATDEEIEQMIKDINSLAIKNPVDYLNTYGEELNKLSDAYIAFKKGERINASTLSSLQDAFGDLDSYKEFEQQVLAGNTDLQESFDAIATELAGNILNNMNDLMDVTDGLTEENKEYYISELESVGIVNAREVVEAKLSRDLQLRTNIIADLRNANSDLDESQKELIINENELANATYEEVYALVTEAGVLEETGNALNMYALQKWAAQDVKITTSDDCKNLLQLAKAAGITATAIGRLEQAKSEFERFDQQIKDISSIGGDVTWLVAQRDRYAGEIGDLIKNEVENYKLDFNLDVKFDGGDGVKDKLKADAESAKNEYDELFDYFERRVKVLEDSTNLLSSSLENLNGSLTKNQILDAESKIYQEELKNYSDALNMYQEMADRAFSKLPDDVAEKIKNGAVSINEFMDEAGEEVVNAINDYTQWADKVSDARNKLEELKKTLRTLELDKFNNIVKDFTDQFDIYNNSKSLIDKQINLFSEAGQLIGESFYSTQINETQKQLGILEKERTSLVNQINSALSSGNIEAGTEEWLEMINTLNDLDGSIWDCKKEIESLDNSILALHTEIFDRIQNQFSSFNDELSNTIGLIDHLDVANKDNTWTKEGLTQLGAYAQQYELAQYRVSQYDNEVQKLNADYLVGKYSATEYADKLIELNNAQWEAVNSAESAKDSIVSLNEARVQIVVDGINEEIQAYKELIDSQIKSLEAEKDLHSWQKSLAESNKNIANIRKQIAAMQNDDTAATVAKRKKLEEELAKALEDLEEKQYDHSIQTQEDALNEQYDAYEKQRNQEIEDLQNTLKDRENIIAQSFDAVKNNADLIGSEIERITTEHGVQISDTLTNSWQAGENAIASYGEVLNQNSSAFIGDIQLVEAETWNLQEQANQTAVALSNMFDTKADALYAELSESYYAESNLVEMTNALQDSLINTLERGYDISGITSALKAVSDEINKTGASIDNTSEKYNKLKKDMGVTDAPVEESSNSILVADIAQKVVKQEVDVVNKAVDKMAEVSDTLDKTANITANILKNSSLPVSARRVIPGFASGTHNLSTNELAWTQELGREAILSPTRNAILTPLKKGDSVLTKLQTDNLYEWAKLNPAGIMEKLTLRPINLPNNMQMPSMNIENLVTVNGNIDDSNLQKMQSFTQNAINDAFRRFSSGIRK